MTPSLFNLWMTQNDAFMELVFKTNHKHRKEIPIHFETLEKGYPNTEQPLSKTDKTPNLRRIQIEVYWGFLLSKGYHICKKSVCIKLSLKSSCLAIRFFSWMRLCFMQLPKTNFTVDLTKYCCLIYIPTELFACMCVYIYVCQLKTQKPLPAE